MDQPPGARNVRKVTAWWNDDFQYEFDWDTFSTGKWRPPAGAATGDASGKSAGDWSGWGGKPGGRNSGGKTKKTEGRPPAGAATGDASGKSAGDWSTWDPDPWATAPTVAPQHGGGTHVDGAAQDGGGTQVDGASQHGGGTDDKGVDGASQPDPQFGFPLPRPPPPPISPLPSLGCCPRPSALLLRVLF